MFLVRQVQCTTSSTTFNKLCISRPKINNIQSIFLFVECIQRMDDENDFIN